MSTLTIQMPEGLARKLREYAAREGVTVDPLLSAAAGEKLSALLTVEHLRVRARRGIRCEGSEGHTTQAIYHYHEPFSPACIAQAVNVIF
jgi:hypothetical protein